MPRIVFSIAFFRQKLPVQLVSTSTKSRWKFYTQVRRGSFHTAWASILRCPLRVRFTLNIGPLRAALAGPFRANIGSGQPSFYHFVGAGNQDRGQLDAQCSRDAEIDPEVELGGTLERQVAWFCAFQHAIKLCD
jgi:hypothetical protein